MSVDVKLDFRSVVGHIRYYAKNKVVESVNAPGVKTQIYIGIVAAMADSGYTPEDTGALKFSPFNPSPQSFGKSKKMKRYKIKKFDDGEHYSYGSVDDRGIVFDPYTETADGIVHYASLVQTFQPYRWVNEHVDEYRDIVRSVIVREANN